MTDFTLEDGYGGPVIGIDEVGRGPLAGPVVAACVYIPPEIRSHPFIKDIKDSKKLSKPKLKILNALINQHCHVSIASHTPEEIDQLNILEASLSAMKQACEELLHTKPIYALIDGNITPPDMPIASQTVTKGDNKSKSIAAASIVAKYYRDEIMRNLHNEFPHYGWDKNVGYPTAQHRDAIEQFGVTLHHRKSFSPVRKYIERFEAKN